MPMFAGHLLFLFSALGAINGLFLAIYFFSRRPHRLANSMLGALLLVIAVRTAKSTLYFFNRDLAVEFLQIGLSACLLIGPLTYLYVHYHLVEFRQAVSGHEWRWHLSWPFFVIALGCFFPYSEYRIIWRYSIYGIHAVWFSYLLAAAWQLWRSRAILFDDVAPMSRNTFLLLSVFCSSGVILIAYVTTPLTSYIVGALSFTFSVHITVIAFMLRKEALVDAGKKEKYQNRKLTEDDALKLLASLNQVMHEQQLHLHPNLTLALLAKKTGSLQTTVSQVLNDRLNKSFNLYVNEFRIEDAKKLLLNEPHLNMELVAERCGFNSNSTFFAAFKKITEQTPASYRAASKL
ncbi:AraC family transcriptional regulator [Undibacterium flavidum]|uniref:Helix-turn-helix domain-containing protein n=1 Tax=Undibacterium flavidum TaxID=2762297 RepID=A0ABR6YF12_9BURK|nr:helix-turn-helix domain-containing protein [Undibacterium flavidum]MBC3875169.1 helix-turn-helix domain-containing protein [Undibacterium flavidum]